MGVDASDVTGHSCLPCVMQSSFLQPLHSPKSSPKLSERGRGLAPHAQTSSRNAGSDSKGAHRRPGWETAVRRCMPPNFWEKSQILYGYVEVLMFSFGPLNTGGILKYWTASREGQ